MEVSMGRLRNHHEVERERKWISRNDFHHMHWHRRATSTQWFAVSYRRWETGHERCLRSKELPSYWLVESMNATGSITENKSLTNQLMFTRQLCELRQSCANSVPWKMKLFATALSVKSPRLAFDKSCYKSRNWHLRSVWTSFDRPKLHVLILRRSVDNHQAQTRQKKMSMCYTCEKNRERHRNNVTIIQNSRTWIERDVEVL